MAEEGEEVWGFGMVLESGNHGKRRFGMAGIWYVFDASSEGAIFCTGMVIGKHQSKRITCRQALLLFELIDQKSMNIVFQSG
jgi:hypothetical protein